MKTGRRQLFNNDVLAAKIAAAVHRFRQNTVRLLQYGERRCTLLQKKALLIAFILLFGGYCGWTLLRACCPRQDIIRLPMPRMITLPPSPWLQRQHKQTPNNH